MLTFLYIIQFVISILLIIVVMFQKSEGGTGLINSNQANNFFSNKSFSSNPLSKVTTVLGFILFVNCICIAGVLVNKQKSNDISKQIEAKINNKNSVASDISSKTDNSSVVDKDKELSVPLAK